MKLFKNILIVMIALVFATACDEGIDSITPVESGDDERAPIISINYPTEGTTIKVLDLITSIDIDIKVTDDIEIASISVVMDGAEIAYFNTFPDYRIALEKFPYDNVTTGDHIMTVTATDLEGKSTTSSVNFSKKPPYTPLFDGELFYMPFDGDYMEMISFQIPEVVGNPDFSTESVGGAKSYKGAADSYLTFPVDGLQNNELTAVFWMKINAAPDRAGILVMGPEDVANPDAQNDRTRGFRFFRENAGGKQRFKLNAGNGTADAWFDGGEAADVDPTIDQWVHMAFTISNTECVVYIDGQVVKQGAFDGIDWTGCDVLSIMSGAPRFTGWSHFSDESLMDELRLFNKALTQSEIQEIITEESGIDFTYTPKYEGEIFYMPFEDDYLEYVSQDEATIVGTPGFSENGKVGKAYVGATDSYLTFPTDNILSNNFSAVFWMKINESPDRAGILVVGPPDTENANYPEKQNKRTNGFRFFRENAGGMQRFKLNAGTGTADTWFDGGEAADLDPTVDTWHHFAFTISGEECVIYFDGEVVKQDVFEGIDWTGCDVMSIMSGAPRFNEWDHWSDEGMMDELRLFNKALSQTEVQGIMNDEM